MAKLPCPKKTRRQKNIRRIKKWYASMDQKLLRYTLRVDRILFQKFRYIAESEGRSANKEMEQYLKKRVAEYEKEFGKIEVANHSLSK